MYYGIIMAAVTMFAFQFLFNRQYEKLCGNTLRAAAVFSLGTSLAGFVILLALNRFRVEFTLFSFLIALAAAVNNLLYSYCSIKALGKINLSLYSVFAMLGGMTLPFIAGIAFFDEAPTGTSTTLPSRSLSIPCCTASPLTSRWFVLCFFAILSISSMKMMPRWAFSTSPSAAASSWLTTLSMSSPI